MTLQTLTLVLRSLETGRTLARALVCPRVQYASIWWIRGNRIDRRFATAEAWRALEMELRPGLDAGPLPREAAVVEVLLEPDQRSGITVQYLVREDLDVSGPEHAARALDAQLRMDLT